MSDLSDKSSNSLVIKVATIAALLDDACSTYENKIALVCNSEQLTYSELNRLSHTFTNYLVQQGFKKGDVIALMMPNILAYPIALFAAFRLGMTVVNVNPMYTASEVEKVIADSNAKAMLVFAPVMNTVNESGIQSKLKCLISVLPGPLLNVGATSQSTNESTFQDIINISAESSSIAAQVNSDDIAFLQYTGGTTGTPKAAVLTNENIVASVYQFQAMMNFIEDGEEVILAPLPLYHIFGLVVTLLSSLSQGGTVLLVPDPRDIPNMSDLLRKWPVTIMYGVSALYSGLYHVGNLTKQDLESLKMCASGATALSKDIADKWFTLTGKPIVEGYGMTETSGLISVQPDVNSALFGTVGKSLVGSEISIRDENGAPATNENDGEICIKGPQVMQGYLNNPEETSKVFTKDGFLKTGDIGRIDEQGYIWIIDRVKDMINVSGFNVYPNEVEQVIDTFDGVLESGCVGFYDEKSGELVKAYVVPANGGEVDTEKLLAHCRNHLTAYKIPKQVISVPSLPKSPVGKILRRKLKELPSAAII